MTGSGLFTPITQDTIRLVNAKPATTTKDYEDWLPGFSHQWVNSGIIDRWESRQFSRCHNFPLDKGFQRPRTRHYAVTVRRLPSRGACGGHPPSAIVVDVVDNGQNRE